MGLVRSKKRKRWPTVHLDSTAEVLKIRTGPLGVVEWQRADDWSVMNKELIRVLVIDDHAVVREGLKHVISRQMDMLVAGEASTRAEALKVAWTSNASTWWFAMSSSRTDRAGTC